MKRIVILGAGTAGTIMANRLARQYRDEIEADRMSITVVDQDDHHIYQPGLLFIPFDMYRPASVTRPRRQQLPESVGYLQAPVDRVDATRDLVVLQDGMRLSYDVLILATGTRLVPEETEGLTGAGWREKVFDFYTLAGAVALRDALARWTGGRLVVSLVDMPIKCPVAPLEFAFLADWFLTRKGVRDRTTITYVTPLDGAFTKPACTTALTYLFGRKQIELVTEFATGRIDADAGKLISWDDREVDFDLLVTVPLHAGQAFVGRSDGLGDDMGFVKTDPNTLQAERKVNIFALGDCTNLPSSKAGSVAHFQAELLAENITRFLQGEPLDPGFDGHSNCFIETGYHKALLIDFNYAVEPLPGRFPLPLVGPMALLKESRLNHLGKLAFKWVYWNLLLPGKDLPLIQPQMTMRGKHQPAPPAAAVR